MNAMTLTGLRQMELQDIPAPEIKNPGDVLIRIGAVGVCGSDVHYYATGKIGDQVVAYPFRVGHECAGIVEATGAEVSQVAIGDRVAVDPLIPCDPDGELCDQCAGGRENTCRNQAFLGCPGQAEGCLCEYIVMPQDSCYTIAESTPLSRAVLVEPLSIGCYSVKESVPLVGANVAVLGAGPIGLSTIIPAVVYGAEKVYATDKLDYRLRAAMEAGATWAGNPDRQDVTADILAAEPDGVDCVFECCGQQEAIDQAVEILKPGGKLMITGIPRVDRISFDISGIRRKELTIFNVRRQNGCMTDAIELLEDPEVNTDFMISHCFGFSETQKAFDLVDAYADDVIKAVIELE